MVYTSYMTLSCQWTLLCLWFEYKFNFKLAHSQRVYITYMQSNQMLKILNLAYNGFGQEGAAALADALKLNSTLTELDITLV